MAGLGWGEFVQRSCPVRIPPRCDGLPQARPPALRTRPMSRTLALLVFVGVGWPSTDLPVRTASGDEGKPDPARREFFEGKVRPILEGHCFGCHGPAKQKAGLRLDSRGAMMRGGDSGPILEPGDPQSSRLI